MTRYVDFDMANYAARSRACQEGVPMVIASCALGYKVMPEGEVSETDRVLDTIYPGE